MNYDKHCSFCSKHGNEAKFLIEGKDKRVGNVYICDECVDSAHKAIYQNNCVATMNYKDTSPKKLKDVMDEYVIGQDEAKKALSVCVYNHLKRINSSGDIKIDKSNLLMIGNSGTGKTLLAKTVSEHIGLPCLIVDATTFTESGYHGDDVSQILQRLLVKCEYDIDKAQSGIIFIDEIDKITASSDSFNARDISGKGVQQALLKMIEGHEIYIEDEESGVSTAFDTSNLLFICSGAFVGIDEVISRSSTSSKIGFNHVTVKNDDMFTVTTEHLAEYGLIPEFLGRVPNVTRLHSLTESMLFDILTKPKNCLKSQYAHIFEMDGIDLQVSDDYYRSIASKCLKSKTGARDLRKEVELTLMDLQFELPDLRDKGVKKIQISKSGKSKLIYGNSNK